MAEILKTPEAVPLVTADGKSYLLTASSQHEGTSWLLWLEEDGPRTWSVIERAGLAVAGLSLVRLVTTRTGTGSWTSWLECARRQQRLEAAATIVGRLAHDFNNVLTSVLGFTELSLGKISPAGPAHQFLSEAYVAAKKGSELVAKLALLCKRPAPSACRASLARALANEESRAQKAGREKGRLTVNLPGNLPALAIDGDSLGVVLTRLLDNAYEAIATTGSVTLSARWVELTRSDCVNLLGDAAPGPHVEIAVADSGCGLSPEARQRVFLDPFFSTKPRYRGLGLATVYGIVRAYHGGIRLEEGRDTGTVVRVYLPEASPEAATVVLRRSALAAAPFAVPAPCGAEGPPT